MKIPPYLEALASRFPMDRVPLEMLRARLRSVAEPESLHRITEAVSPPPAGCAESIPEDLALRESLRREGEERLARGELAAVVLAGGMATRFGSVVKALSPVFGENGPSFLDAKLRDIARWKGAVRVALMTSFATHDAVEATLRVPRLLPPALRAEGVALAPQFVSLRLRPDGEYFETEDGELSPYSPGHGDLPDALATAGVLAKWKAAGVRTVLVSNVDNIGATVDPTLFAMHARSGAKITVELVEKNKGDKGGLPVALGDRLVLAEAFRLPEGFPAERFPLFNTNTLWIDIEALEGEMDWTWCVARKTVEGAEAIQFERLVGELTWWNPTHWVHVPRVGAETRFIPIKDHDDLERQREALLRVWRERLGGAPL
ncbi:MAG: UTP--glucose-1-phosphate uridylyltransferase [Polyangiales bacterium]